MAVMSLPRAELIPAARLRTRSRAITLPDSHVLNQKSARALDRAIMGNPVPYPTDVARPRTRGECIDAPRPCPWVSCKFHNYLDVHPITGAMKIHRPDLDLEEMAETCVLDIADRGGLTLEEIGEMRSLTRERVRQQQEIGLALMAEAGLDLSVPADRETFGTPSKARPTCP